MKHHYAATPKNFPSQLRWFSPLLGSEYSRILSQVRHFLPLPGSPFHKYQSQVATFYVVLGSKNVYTLSQVGNNMEPSIMKSMQVIENKAFIGRDFERQLLHEISEADESAIIILYGRRRVGKTELIEQTYHDRNLIKIEGLEKHPESEQIEHTLSQISHYCNQSYIAKLKFTRWTEVFELLAELLAEGTWTLYFEEVQWLANYNDKFISELKYVWDNRFRHNQRLRIVLCGSSPSFMIRQVLHSKALYNRSQHEIHLDEFSIKETEQFLQRRSRRDVMDAYLTLGGIPEYLKRVAKASSVFLGICKHSFMRRSFFSKEYERIFISSLAESSHYHDIIQYLSKCRFATRKEIAKHLGIASGGSLSNLISDLELCGFIHRYTPFNVANTSMLSRYSIADNYLMFYYKFIQPIEHDIEDRAFHDDPTLALNLDTYHKWLGFAFERFCRKNHRLIAKMLGFSSVKYKSGAFFNKRTDKETPGYQIDLVFERADHVYTICEIRYLKTQVNSSIIEEFEQKKSLFPNKHNWTIEHVLISAKGATDSLINQGYFDRIITLDDFFDEKYW